MLKKIVHVLCLLFPLLAIGQVKTFEVKARLADPKVKGKVFFAYKGADRKFHADSVNVQAGTFRFVGTVLEPTEAQIGFRRIGAANSGGAEFVKFMVYDTLVTIDITSRLNDDAIQGGAVQRDYVAYKKALHFTNAEIGRLNDLSNASRHRKDKAFVDSLKIAYEEVATQRKGIQSRFIQENPNSYFSVSALRDVAGSYFDPKVIEPLLLSLSPKWKNTVYYRELKEKVQLVKKTTLGTEAPDFALPTPEGKVVRLSDFKGQYVLIDFWASWCGPCRAENPHVIEAYTKFKPMGLEIIGISLDAANQKEAWLKAIKDDGLTWIQVSDLLAWKSPITADYGIKAIPQNFLIDPAGKIVAANLRGDELIETLTRILTK